MNPAVAEVLSRLPAGIKATSASDAGGGFSGAIVVRLETAAGPFALRGWPADADAKRIAALHRLLNHLRQSDVETIAVPLPWEIEALLSHRNRLWQLEPWLAGVADFHSDPNDNRLRNAMLALADWHLAAATVRSTGSEQRWFRIEPNATSPGLRDRLELLRTWQRKERTHITSQIEADEDTDFAALARRIIAATDPMLEPLSQQLSSAIRETVSLQPVLRDVWHDHLLFDGDRVTGVIDPAAARTDCVSADLARLLGSLIGNESSRWEFALAAYEERRPLSVTERQLIAVFDASGVVLSGINWLRRRYLLGTQFGNREHIFARIAGILDRLP